MLGVEPGDLVRQDTVTAAQAQALDELVARRATRIPLQHLTGRAYFRHLTLEVGPGVFVPRPETEVVVEAVLDEVRGLTARGVRRPVVVDLCTGSGAIAASVAVETPAPRSPPSSCRPRRSPGRERNLAALEVDLRLGDAAAAFADLDGAVDVVVSNPPYVPPGAVIRDPEVLEHDPPLALWGGGDDGLDVMRGVVARAAGLLRPGGCWSSSTPTSRDRPWWRS